MKKRYLVTAAITAALMAAGAVGGTIAYFTSESKTTASIEAGVVRMSMEAKNLKLYSLDVERTGENAGTFENGGKATLEDAVLKLEKMTPGDKVEFDLTLENHSNVLIKYQVLHSFANEKAGVENDDDLTYATAKLSRGLVFSMKDGEGNEAPATMTQLAPTSDAVLPTYHVSVELPVEAGNEYQGASSDVIFNLFAVQANKPVEALVVTYDQLVESLASNAKVELMGDVEIPASETLSIPAGADLIGNGHVISSNGGRGASAIKLEGNATIEDVVLNVTDEEVINANGHGFTLKGVEVHAPSYSDMAYSSSTLHEDVVIENCVLDGGWDAFYDSYFRLDNEHDITIKGSTINTYAYTLNSHCRNLVVEDSTIQGWTSFNNEGTVSFTRCTFKAGSAYNYIRCYDDTLFEECKFYDDGAEGVNFQAEIVNGAIGTLNNCQVAARGAELHNITDDKATFKDFFTLVNSGYTEVENGSKLIVNGTTFIETDLA